MRLHTRLSPSKSLASPEAVCDSSDLLSKTTAYRDDFRMDNQRSGECDPLVAQQVEQLAATLLDWFQSGRYLIALSGGVDSAVVACAAQRSGCEAIAVTADSPSVAGREKEDAARVADLIGIKHHVLQTDEIADSRYRANDGQRCFHCKSHLFETIRQHFQTGTILTGTNADDLGDYRPGLRAAEAFDVQAPLAELGFKKRTSKTTGGLLESSNRRKAS